MISTNLNGIFNMTHPVWPGMRDRKFGRIINISSVNGQKGQAGQVNYSAAKAGDIGFTKALAQEGARAGITVNAICPGYIGTEMVRAIDEKVLNERILPQIPVGRLGEPEEIARCVVFLASDEVGLHHRLDAFRQWRPVHGLSRHAAGRRRRRSPNSRDKRWAACRARAALPPPPASAMARPRRWSLKAAAQTFELGPVGRRDRDGKAAAAEMRREVVRPDAAA